MALTKYTALAFLVAYAEARFGQEQVPVSAVSALSDFGEPGQAATLAGSVPGVLLAAASPCDKLTLADNIVSTLGDDPAVISAAAGVVAAEQNFNPFNVEIPSICGDASLPATEALRGIVPLVDPAVDGSDVENANSAASLTTPFDATGLSVADVMTAQGFTNFQTVDASGNAAAGADAAAGDDSTAAAAAAAADANTNAAASGNRASAGCGAARSSGSNASSNSSASSDDSSSSADSSSADQSSADDSAAASNSTANAATDLTGVDFGQCTPTIDFQLGRAEFNRQANEGTFFPTDDNLVANTGQTDALNPNIITNFVCDQLVNVCGANQAAQDACASAQDLVAGLGTKDASTADAFNQALGF